MVFLDFNDMYKEWWIPGMETASKGREEAHSRTLEIWDLLLFLLLACWVPWISQCTLLQCSIFFYRKWGGEASKYLPWGRKAPRLSIPVKSALDYWLFGVPYILSSPCSFLLSCLSRNGNRVIEQLMNTTFHLGIKISSLVFLTHLLATPTFNMSLFCKYKIFTLCFDIFLSILPHYLVTFPLITLNVL